MSNFPFIPFISCKDTFYEEKIINLTSRLKRLEVKFDDFAKLQSDIDFFIGRR